MQKEEKMICGIPEGKWLRAFGAAVEDTIDHGGFCDIFQFYLYQKVDINEDNKKELWQTVYNAFEEIFGYKLFDYDNTDPDPYYDYDYNYEENEEEECL